ncbi:MAG TPA: hypothetical protein VK856_07465 [Anaerolineaceae bacterium]|nr:hypothetical protein [Anaerolineaceae bacterium]
MIFGPPPYYSGKTPSPDLVLDRYLPPYPMGSLSDMLQFMNIPKGWLLDPIGNQPLSAIELAQEGYQVFVACNNPILGRLLEVICAAHPINQFQAAIADLGALKRGEERVETQIKHLYLSPCPECQSTHTKVQYLWKRTHKIPFAREITCHKCGNIGIFKLSETDIDNMNNIGNTQLHKTRLLQRVLPGIKEPPASINEVLNSYLPRSISVISSLVNKIDSINTSPQRKTIIEAILIQVFDVGNMLWGISSGRNRPKQLSIPAEFFEFNLWDAIEEAVANLQIIDKPIPFSYFPELPPVSGGICFYPSRIQSLTDNNNLPKFSAIATVLPRPNQALWTYNAVWSGWLWGNQAAQKLKGALERRRYDWIWHSQAIRKIFDYSSNFRIPFLAVAPELTNSYILAYLAAASSSGFRLINSAYQHEIKSGQFYWVPGERVLEDEKTSTNVKNLKNYLQMKSEPANYQELLSVFFISETIDNNPNFPLKTFDNNLFLNAQSLFDRELMKQENFIQVDEDQLENGDFWLSNPPLRYQPISDLIEKEFIQFVQKTPEFYLEEITYSINLNQPGLLPASNQHLQRLISSYCEPKSTMSQKWILNSQDATSERKKDFSQMKNIIEKIGEKLGFEISGGNPILWFSETKKPNFQFFITASSILSQFNEKFDPNNYEIVIIFPGSRSNILSYKIRNDPVYKQHFGIFHFVKFRHLRAIFENPSLNMRIWDQILDSDPAVWQESSQPGLF